jgi:hypothetical protein
VSDTIDPDEKLADADEGRTAEDLPVVAPRPMTRESGFVTQIQAAVDLQSAPEDLRELLEALAAEGISATLPTAGPDDPLHEPLVVRTSLSAAIIEEREE